MAEETNTDISENIEPRDLVTEIAQKLPVHVNETVVTLTENLVSEFRNRVSTTRKQETIILGVLTVTLRKTDSSVSDAEIVACLEEVINECDSPNQSCRFTLPSEKSISRTRRKVCKELDIQLEPTTPESYADEVYGSPNIPNEVVDAALEFIDDVPGEMYAGSNPICVLAGAIYIVGLTSDHHITQQTIADDLNVSQTSVRKHFKSLSETDIIPQQLPSTQK